jgi:choline kinase
MSGRDVRTLRAIVLAAGLGSRLGAYTAHRHKCLVQVGDRPILGRTFSTLAAAGVRTATLVVGHLGAQVRAYADVWSSHLDIRCVVNDQAASTGTAYSLALGLATAVSGEDVLVIEADVVFGHAALMQLLSAQEPNVTLVAPFGAYVSGSAVLCDDDAKVLDWLHATHQGMGFRRDRASKTVNLTRLDCPTRAALFGHCIAARPDSPLENAMRALVRAHVTSIYAVDVRSAPWCEVDTPEDLSHAEELFGGDAPITIP